MFVAKYFGMSSAYGRVHPVLIWYLRCWTLVYSLDCAFVTLTLFISMCGFMCVRTSTGTRPENGFLIESGEPMLLSQLMERLKSIQYDKARHGENQTCPICLSDYKESDEVVELPCDPRRHFFHANCIRDHFAAQGRAFCPLCRKDILSILPQQQ